MCLLVWIESLLIRSLSSLCTGTAALHHTAVRGELFSLMAVCSPILGAGLRTGFIICTHVQGQPPWSFHLAWDSASSFFPAYSDTISTLVKSLFAVAPPYSSHTFYSQAGIRHWPYVILWSWLWDHLYPLGRVFLHVLLSPSISKLLSQYS